MLDRLSPLTEVLMVRLGMQGGRLRPGPRTMYEVYPFNSRNLTQERLKIRFKKMHHGLILRERRLGVTSCLHTEILSGIIPVTGTR